MDLTNYKAKVAAVARAIDAGMTRKQVCVYLNMTPSTASNYASRARRRFRRANAKSEPNEIEIAIMRAIDAGAATSQEISDVTGIKKTYVSVVLNQMRDRGFVESTPTIAREPGRPYLKWRVKQ